MEHLLLSVFDNAWEQASHFIWKWLGAELRRWIRDRVWCYILLTSDTAVSWFYSIWSQLYHWIIAVSQQLNSTFDCSPFMCVAREHDAPSSVQNEHHSWNSHDWLGTPGVSSQLESHILQNTTHPFTSQLHKSGHDLTRATAACSSCDLLRKYRMQLHPNLLSSEFSGSAHSSDLAYCKTDVRPFHSRWSAPSSWWYLLPDDFTDKRTIDMLWQSGCMSTQHDFCKRNLHAVFAPWCNEMSSATWENLLIGHIRWVHMWASTFVANQITQHQSIAVLADQTSNTFCQWIAHGFQSFHLECHEDMWTQHALATLPDSWILLSIGTGCITHRIIRLFLQQAKTALSSLTVSGIDAAHVLLLALCHVIGGVICMGCSLIQSLGHFLASIIATLLLRMVATQASTRKTTLDASTQSGELTTSKATQCSASIRDATVQTSSVFSLLCCYWTRMGHNIAGSEAARTPPASPSLLPPFSAAATVPPLACVPGCLLPNHVDGSGSVSGQSSAALILTLCARVEDPNRGWACSFLSLRNRKWLLEKVGQRG